MTNSIHELITSELTESLKYRFDPSEVDSSVVQIALRWGVIDEGERRKVARTLGGNRYAKTAYHMLDSIFKSIVSDYVEGSNDN